jgi:hypothetical protein
MSIPVKPGAPLKLEAFSYWRDQWHRDHNSSPQPVRTIVFCHF